MLIEALEKRDNVFVYYASFAQLRAKVETGFILMFQNGKLVGECKYRDVLKVSKFANRIHVHLKAVIRLFETFGRYMLPSNESPLIYTNSPMAIKWMQNNYFLPYQIEETKSKLYSYLSLYNPEFRSYDAKQEPFRLLRDLSWEETLAFKNLVAERKIVNWEGV